MKFIKIKDDTGGGREGEIKTFYIVNGEDNLFTNSMNLMTFILID